MSGKIKFAFSPINSGYTELTLTSWNDFFELINRHFLSYEKMIWRGQRSPSWLLEPTINRTIKELNIPLAEQNTFKGNQLERFKLASRGRRGSHPSIINSETEWWAIGQHFGLDTPLLDWSNSPYVAAYFAFYNSHSNETHRAIYGLFKPSVEEKIEADYILKCEKLRSRSSENMSLSNLLSGNLKPVKELEFYVPISDENQRVINQNGLFTINNTILDIRSLVEKLFIGFTEGMILTKVLIPNSDRDICLQSLNRMNINHLTLFPDLIGAAEYCNTACRVKNY